MKKSTIICLLILAAIFIGGAVFLMNYMGNYIQASDGTTYEQMSDEEKEKYTGMVLIPDLKNYCVRYNIRSFGPPQDGKWKRVIVECTDIERLPDEYQEPIRIALRSDDFISTTDIGGKSVKVYTIESGMPLADVNDLSPEYRELAARVSKAYYQVMVYPDGLQKFIFWFEYA